MRTFKIGKHLEVTGAAGRYGSLGYRSARIAGREGTYAIGASGEAHQNVSRGQLINQSRQFMMNNGIYEGMINRAVSYIVGNGFDLQMKSKSPSYNEKVEKLMKQQRRRPEIRQLITGKKNDRMICRETLVAGDTILIKTKSGLLQHIEAEQLAGQSPNEDGIKKDEFGKPIKYYIGPYSKHGRADRGRAGGYDPDVILFITNPQRPSATRGVPICQSVFPMLHRINDVCDSEAIAWQLLARIAVSVNREGGDELAISESKADPGKTDTEGQLTTRLTELDYALIFHAGTDEEIKGVEHNIPSKNFSESLRMFLRLLGLPLGLPLELILLDWTQSNYSQSRAVLEQAYQSFLDHQEALEDFYYIPYLEWQIRRWRKAGLIAERKDGFDQEWIKPTFPWIDQLKEVQAYGEKIDRGIVTHAMVCKSLKTDRGDVVDAREREVRDAIDRAKKIKDDTGIDVPWQIFCGMKPPKMESIISKDDDKKENYNE